MVDLFSITWQQPLSNHVILVAENTSTAVEDFVKLVVRITKVTETILPNAHVFERTERFIVGWNPVRAESEIGIRIGYGMKMRVYDIYLKNDTIRNNPPMYTSSPPTTSLSARVKRIRILDSTYGVRWHTVAFWKYEYVGNVIIDVSC